MRCKYCDSELNLGDKICQKCGAIQEDEEKVVEINEVKENIADKQEDINKENKIKKLEKNNKILLMLLIIVLVVVGVLVALYFVMGTDNKTLLQPQDQEKEQAPDKESEKEDELEHIDISEDRLKQYLSYVPVSISGDESFEEMNDYKNIDGYNGEYIDINSIDKRLLVGQYNFPGDKLLFNTEGLMDEKDREEFRKQISQVNLTFQGKDLFGSYIGDGACVLASDLERDIFEKYNFDLKNVNYHIFPYSGGYTIKTDDSKYYCYNYGCPGSRGKNFHHINKYEIENDKLVIYSSVGFLFDEDFEASLGINTTDKDGNYKLVKEWFYCEDGYTDDVITEVFDYDKIYELAQDYVDKHPNEFKAYKHTFVKTKTGYAWYSSEGINYK